MRFSGIVKPHKGRGRQMGFPTANIEAPKAIEEGIYLAHVRAEGMEYASLVFIGAAETFGEHDRKAEIYLLKFQGDLYGKELEVELIKKIRNNEKFANQETLIKQMEEDKRVAEDYFSKHDSRG